MTVCILDTSVFCNLIAVPGRSQQGRQARTKLGEYVRADVSLLLPIAVIYETGNHIAHCGDGRERRQAAERFVKEVRGALEGRAPYAPASATSSTEDIIGWLDGFPDEAARGVSLADLSIQRVFERQCVLNPARRVFIWSYDKHLSSYDRRP